MNGKKKGGKNNRITRRRVFSCARARARSFPPAEKFLPGRRPFSIEYAGAFTKRIIVYCSTTFLPALDCISARVRAKSITVLGRLALLLLLFFMIQTHGKSNKRKRFFFLF